MYVELGAGVQNIAMISYTTYATIFFFFEGYPDNLFHQDLALSSFLYDFWELSKLSAINNC